MKPLRFPIVGIAAAATLAGPIFFMWAAVALFYRDRSITFTWEDIGNVALILSVSAVFGFIISIGPVIVGSLLMLGASRFWSGFRTRLAWAMAGAAGGLIVGLCWKSGAAMTLAMAATGATCGLICRWGAAPDATIEPSSSRSGEGPPVSGDDAHHSAADMSDDSDPAPLANAADAARAI